jgi:ATP-dependent Clp protease ATP-binding subunit ClpA
VSSLSPALLLTWDISANEAAHLRQTFIEPEHLFIALCKLEDFSTTASLVDLGYDASEATAMETEIRGLVDLFYHHSLNPTSLRRELRQRKSTGMLQVLSGWTTGILRPARENDTNVIHRSPTSRLLFSRADELALMTGSLTTTVAHLLAAILDDPQSKLCLWLNKRSINVDALRQGALDLKIQPKRTSSTP